MTENAAIVNTHFLLNPSASSGFTGISLKMSSGRMQPGSRAYLRHGPAEAAAIFVGTAEPAPFLQSIENARPTDLRRVCGGFSGAGRPQLQRRNGPDDAEEPAAQPAAGGHAGGHTGGHTGGHAGAVHPAGRAARLPRRTAMGRIPEYPDTGTPLEQRPKRPQAGAGFASSTTVRKGTVRKGTVRKGTVRKGDEKRQSSLPRQLTRGRLFRPDSRKTESDPKSG